MGTKNGCLICIKIVKIETMSKQYKYIDLFCGIGGFHQALNSLGHECVFASDIDKQCRYTYELNYGITPEGDITKIDEKDVPTHDIICAGFPCQSFSKSGNRKGINDPRGTLFFDILRIAKHHQPKYLILENVRNLAGHDNGRTWKIIYDNLVDIGYSVKEKPIIFSPHYLGIPQNRERVFILCQRKDIGQVPDFNFNYSKDTQCSIDDVLSKDKEIVNLTDYQLKKDQIELINHWNEFIQNITKPLPGFPIWADRLKELDPDEDIESLAKWEKTFILKNNILYKENKSFVDKWLEKSSKIALFSGSKAMFEWQAGQVEHPDIWETIMHFRPSGIRVKKPTYFPALVAITQTSIVGKLQRFITPREGARLQNFPEEFVLNEKDNIAYKQLGNAVNVEVVKMFADFLINNEDFSSKKYNLNIVKDPIDQLQLFT